MSDKLSPDTELRLAPEIEMTLMGDQLTVSVGNAVVYTSAEMLAVLDAFRQPLTLRRAMEALPTRTDLDWMELSATIVHLQNQGVLVGDSAPIDRMPTGFASVDIHVRMLDDETRTRYFVDAVRSVVKPGDVVVDLGTGTGVLAIAAAQAGAKHVYAIERTGIADVAQRMFEDNGVADRITLLRNKSTVVELPERADVMVYEIVGNNAFDEQILAYTRDAHARLLRPDARIVPSAIRVLLKPVTATEKVRHEEMFQREAAEQWSQAYGMDFSGLAGARSDQSFARHLTLEQARGLTPLGPSTHLVTIDLNDPPAIVQAEASLPIEVDGRLDGFVLHFELTLAHAADTFGNDPWREGGATSWGIPLWLLPEHIMVSVGDTVRVRYQYTGAVPRLDLIGLDA